MSSEAHRKERLLSEEFTRLARDWTGSNYLKLVELCLKFKVVSFYVKVI